jgi:hypothetical protein
MNDMTPMTRAQAREGGADRYFTGKSCSNGHVSPRYTANAMCVQCSEMHRGKPRERKPLTEEQKERARLKSREYHAANRDAVLAKMSERNAKYYQANKERIKAQTAEYQRANAEARNSYKSAWQTRRSKEDPEFRAVQLMRKLVARSMDRAKRKRGEHERTVQMLGYTNAEFVAHIERLFEAGMSWENHGEWHVDHIRPLSTFDLRDSEQIRLANSLHNLQPLWRKKNLTKSDKWSGQLTLV